MSHDIVKAPWKLKGEGYLFFYKFKKDFILENAFIPEKYKSSFIGGIGAVMLVNYSESDAGPYGELLIIPGKFLINGKKKNMITKIYVSTQLSVDSGRANWAIPKEKADFSFKKKDNNILSTTSVKIEKDGIAFFEAELKPYLFPFPVSTAFVPFPLAQPQNEKIFYTKFNGKGIGRFCKLKNLKIDNSFFPDISNQKLLMAVKVDPFNIVFPKAIVK